MKDFLGKELSVGDQVVVCVPRSWSGADLVSGEVVGITKKRVRVALVTNGFQDNYESYRQPEKVAKV